jgi:hypothetical protein
MWLSGARWFWRECWWENAYRRFVCQRVWKVSMRTGRMKNRVFILLIGLLFKFSGLDVIASQPGPGEPPKVVVSVDPAVSTVTINERGQTMLYHMDPFGTVYLNGTQASLKQLGPGMLVSSLTFSDPTTLTEIKVSEAAQPAEVQSGAQYGSMLPAQELAKLMAKVGNSYWSDSPTRWIYLAADGKLIDGQHGRYIFKWTMTDRYTLLIMDNHYQMTGAEHPSLYKLNASYTVAGPWIRVAVPTAEMTDKVAKLNP